MELVLNLSDDVIRVCDSVQPERLARFSGAIISGPYTQGLMIDPMEHSTILGIHFRPGGALPFLGIRADDLQNMHLDLETLWGSRAAELRERLCALPTARQRFALLEETLLTLLRSRPCRHPAVSIALSVFDQSDGTAVVQEVSRRIGLSQRRFIEIFATEVGLTPKLYCRIRRFRKARELARSLTAPDWAQIAQHCGYFDQSHLIRDFQAFAGLTPKNYLRQVTGQFGQVWPNHVPQTW
jgi:AraC-like DNA-binding protein